jgi:hypothetical protein
VSEQERTLDLRDAETAGLAIAAGGMVTLLAGWTIHSRLLRVLGLLVTAAGASLYAREKLAERSERIDEAATAIRSELDSLDPVGKAQVIASLTEG